MKFDQDLCLNLKYDLGKMNSTLGSVVPLAMFVICDAGNDVHDRGGLRAFDPHQSALHETLWPS